MADGDPRSLENRVVSHLPTPPYDEADQLDYQDDNPDEKRPGGDAGYGGEYKPQKRIRPYALHAFMLRDGWEGVNWMNR